MYASSLRSPVLHTTVMSSATLSFVPSWQGTQTVTKLQRYGDGKLRLIRERGKRKHMASFTLTEQQEHVLLSVLRFPTKPHQVIELPRQGRIRVEARVLPDGGYQFMRFDRDGHLAHTFRLLSAECAPFIAACKQSSRRVSA